MIFSLDFRLESAIVGGRECSKENRSLAPDFLLSFFNVNLSLVS